MKIVLETETMRVTVEADCKETGGDFVDAFRCAMLGASFHHKIVDQYIPDNDRDDCSEWSCPS